MPRTVPPRSRHRWRLHAIRSSARAVTRHLIDVRQRGLECACRWHRMLPDVVEQIAESLP